jgi:hypothetical protein
MVCIFSRNVLTNVTACIEMALSISGTHLRANDPADL